MKFTSALALQAELEQALPGMVAVDEPFQPPRTRRRRSGTGEKIRRNRHVFATEGKIRSNRDVFAYASDYLADAVEVVLRRTAPPVPPTPPMLGVATGDGRRFVLAVRVESEKDVHSQAVRALSERAAGEVDVRVVGRLRPLSLWKKKAVDPDSKLRRPLTIGASVGPPKGEAGTLTCFISRTAAPGCELLSNNHVLASRGKPSDAVLQPAKVDGGTPSAHTVAHLSFVAPLHPDDNNVMDVALSTVDVGVAVDVSGIGSGKLLGETQRSAEELLDMAVQKIGRTTGRTDGQVTAVNNSPRVWYGGRRLRFSGQLEIGSVPGGPAVSGPGDSGSLVYEDVGGDGLAVGLLFAGNPSTGVAYATPIGVVLRTLSATLLV